MNDQLTRKVCWMAHTSVLAEPGTMGQIAVAARKIHKHAAALACA